MRVAGIIAGLMTLLLTAPASAMVLEITEGWIIGNNLTTDAEYSVSGEGFTFSGVEPTGAALGIVFTLGNFFTQATVDGVSCPMPEACGLMHIVNPILEPVPDGWSVEEQPFITSGYFTASGTLFTGDEFVGQGIVEVSYGCLSCQDHVLSRGTTARYTFTVAEPATALLVSLGLGGLTLGHAWRRRRQIGAPLT